MIKCSKVKKILSAYLDQELSQALSDRVKKHLANCLTCRQEHKQLSQIKQLFKEKKTLKADEEGLVSHLEEKMLNLGSQDFEVIGLGSLAYRFIPVPAVLAVLFFIFTFFSYFNSFEGYSLEEKVLSGEIITAETVARLILIGDG